MLVVIFLQLLTLLPLYALWKAQVRLELAMLSFALGSPESTPPSSRPPSTQPRVPPSASAVPPDHSKCPQRYESLPHYDVSPRFGINVRVGSHGPAHERCFHIRRADGSEASASTLDGAKVAFFRQ